MRPDPIAELADRYPDLAPCLPAVEAASAALAASLNGGGQILVCGNGGSAADSEHIVGELMKGFRSERRLTPSERDRLEREWGEAGAYLAGRLQGALPAISLTSQVGLVTAVANDVAADMVFAQQVHGYGRPGDALLAISTSGSSRNVVNAVMVARTRGLATIGLTGGGGGELARLCDVAIRVPFEETARIQERHLPIYHALCAKLEREFFPD